MFSIRKVVAWQPRQFSTAVVYIQTDEAWASSAHVQSRHKWKGPHSKAVQYLKMFNPMWKYQATLVSANKSPTCSQSIEIKGCYYNMTVK